VTDRTESGDTYFKVMLWHYSLGRAEENQERSSFEYFVAENDI
jgi:hypothetical protein